MILLTTQNILRLILENSLFDVRLGVEKHVILSIFGEPVRFAKQHKSYPEILSYGVIEFSLRDGKVCTLKLDFQLTDEFHNIGVDGINFKKLIREDVLETAIKNGIQVDKDYLFSDDVFSAFKLSNGVHLGFEGDKLQKVSVVTPSK